MKVRRFAALAIAALLSAVVSATAQTVNISRLDPLGDPAGAYSGTGFGNTQTVVSNQYGYFATYVHHSDVNLFASTWRLVRSTDGGATFTTVYEGVNHGTPTPAIETDRDGNIYVIYSDSHPLPGGGYSNDAYFMRFMVADNYLNPTILTLPDGAAQKFTTVIDESRQRIYYVATNFLPTPPSYVTVWFFSIPLNGSSYSRTRLTTASVGGPLTPHWDYTLTDAHYPHLYLDEHNNLYAGWTNAIARYKNPVPPATQPVLYNFNYYSIHFMRSRDGAATWENLSGTPITLPVVADHHNNGLTHEVNMAPSVNGPGDRDGGTWLWNMIVKQGKAHFWYRASSYNVPQPMHYVRFDTVTGVRELDTQPAWGGTNYSLNALHGDCSTRRDRLDATIYCLSSTTDGDSNASNDNDRLAVVVTTDNGQTWQDYAATAPNAGCDECFHALGTARQIDEGGRILGTYTPLQTALNHTGPLMFFNVPVPGPSMVQFPATVTTNAADPAYPAWHAGDNNPSTKWVASTSSSLANNHAWIQLDLGSVKEVRHIEWTGATGSPYPAHSPSHYTIAASNDGLHWQTVQTRTYNYAMTTGYEHVFLMARYLRLTTTKVNDGTGWSLGFSEFRAIGFEPPSAPRLSTNWVNISSEQGTYPGGYAVDGNVNTTWVASPATPPNDAWIQIDLGSVRPITRLKWLGAGWNPPGAHSPANYRIEVSPDLVTYRTIVDRTTAAGVIEGDELLAVTARYITLIVSKVNDGTGWLTGLREFWAEGPTP
jgi:hypothetical protein